MASPSPGPMISCACSTRRRSIARSRSTSCAGRTGAGSGPPRAKEIRAFSNEADTGSHQENATKQRSGAAFRFRGIRKRLGFFRRRAAFQEFAQNNGIVARGILRREKQSHCVGFARSISQLGGGWILLQFGEIAGAEQRPFFGVVGIPAP